MLVVAIDVIYMIGTTDSKRIGIMKSRNDIIYNRVFWVNFMLKISRLYFTKMIFIMTNGISISSIFFINGIPYLFFLGKFSLCLSVSAVRFF